jgi:5-methylcytosine-specific restriction endonuclease McrA
VSLTRQEKDKLYYQNNKERKLFYQKRYAESRKEHISEVKAAYYRRTKEAKKAYVSEYRKKYPYKVNALNNKHRADKLKATPKWLTKDQLEEIKQYYLDAEYLTQYIGVPIEVDHIMPLRGKNSCGLHAPWNLQLLTKSENSSKSNKVL